MPITTKTCAMNGKTCATARMNWPITSGWKKSGIEPSLPSETIRGRDLFASSFHFRRNRDAGFGRVVEIEQAHRIWRFSLWSLLPVFRMSNCLPSYALHDNENVSGWCQDDLFSLAGP